MQDSFNPYQAWLGLDTQQPTYYQLLGIEASLRDPRQIRRAADQKSNQVRAFRPGPHTAAWSRILDEIAAAKRVLCDPTARASYNQSLAFPRNPSQSQDTIAAPSDADQAIPWAAPVGSAGSIPYAVPLSDAVVATPPPPSSGAWDPMAPVPLSWADSPPANGARPHLSNGPGLATGIPLPRQNASPPEDTTPQETLPRSVAAASSSVRPVSAARRPAAQARPSRHMLLILAALLVFSTVLVLGIGLGDSRRTASRDADPQQLDSSRPSTPARRDRANSESPTHQSKAAPQSTTAESRVSRMANRTDRQESSPRGEVVDSVLSSLPASPLDVNSSSGEQAIGEQTIGEQAIGEQASSAAGKPVAPAGMAPTTTESWDPGASEASPPPASEKPPSGVPDVSTAPPPRQNGPEASGPAIPSMTLQEREALGKALTTARLALAEQNNEAARREIATAERIARLPEQLEMVGRLKLLAEYAAEYQKALDDALSQLDSGDIIKLRGGAEVAVVEATPQGISIRAAGRNRRFARTEIPAELSIGIADSWLDDSKPGSLVIKGVFLLIHEMGDKQDRQRGRQLLQQAGEQGVDLDDLLQALRDDYNPQPQPSG